ncbi:putative galacturonosyltransferase-like 7 [Canna indica]|uniref:Galacturonosyltransferase-like 7 n=1 Tax=Canna indica TaxID=4628 RepID=A0AAQ3K3Q9_9LILI|nr:putative galacturonosyltransferase-like 7 [Canna indica]
MRSTFPGLRFKTYYFDPERVRGLISTSVRQALEQPLNYARNYLAEILERCVSRVIYLNSNLVVVDDIANTCPAAAARREPKSKKLEQKIVREIIIFTLYYKTKDPPSNLTVITIELNYEGNTL